MASTLLSEFAMVALGRAAEMAPLARRGDSQWAADTLLRASSALANPAEAAAFPDIGDEQAHALAEHVRAELALAIEAAAKSSVRPAGPWAASAPGVAAAAELDLAGEWRALARMADGSLATVGRLRPREPLRGRKRIGIAGIHYKTPEAEKLPMEDWLAPGAASKALVDRAFERAFGASRTRLGELSEECPAASAGLSKALEHALAAWPKWAARQKPLEMALASSFAREAARALYGEGLSKAMAARILMNSAIGSADAPLSGLSRKLSEGALLAGEQTPGAAVVAAALGKPLGTGELGAGAAGAAKAALIQKHGLNSGGWKALCAHAESHPEYFAIVGQWLGALCDQRSRPPDFLNWKKHWVERPTASHMAILTARRKAVDESDSRIHRSPGYVVGGMDADNSFFETIWPRRACLWANMCSAAGLSFSLAADLFDSDNASGPPRPRNPGSDFGGLASIAPTQWRAAIDGLHAVERGTGAPTPAKPSLALESAWLGALRRAGLEPRSLLDPAGFSELAGKGWEPASDAERELLALERERSAREEKAPSLLASLLGRAGKLGARSEAMLSEMESVRDMLLDVELGFWAQAPRKISWDWALARSREWHDLVNDKAASAHSWDPIEAGAVDLGGGWSAKELTDGGQLFAEGRAMSHCVSSYAAECSEGKCRIFAISSAGGLSKSTLELQPSPPEGRSPLREDGKPDIPFELRSRQHKGFANSEPSAGSKLAAAKLIERMSKLCEVEWAARRNAATAARKALKR